MDPVLLIPRKATGSRTLVADSTQYFTCPSASLGTSNFSFCGWVYPTSVSTRGVFRNYDTSTGGITIYLGSDGRIISRYGDGSDPPTSVYTSASAYSALEWMHIVVNVDRAGSLKIYKNTVEVGSADMSSVAAVDYVTGYSSWYIGNDGINAGPFDGRMALCGIVIGDTLSAQDRTDLYNSGAGLKYASFTEGLLTKFSGQDYWNMDGRIGSEPNDITGARPLTAVNNPGCTAGPR